MTTVNQVYTYSVQKYPFYGKNPSKWKNVIRHWLCLNEDFVKVPYPFGKHDGETFWTLRKYAKKEEELPANL
ncbi:hypothetical protein L596_012813 [Steinernema carpocapsae]|uniref:Fork-head domain-containing protein n=1 Tax=Steinernema carpocapsae TaxID=34508 RepID=A0A4U5NY79_STECR|nr:hypothetical protein L596_012813 [Steinernema carpocapsae]